MTEPELTGEMNAAAIAKADTRACSPGNQRCYAFPNAPENAENTCTPKGRCKVG